MRFRLGGLRGRALSELLNDRSAGDPLPVELVAAFEAARDRMAPLGGRIVFFNTIGSTNDAALALAADPDAEGTIVVADEQTAGRGRHGRSWFSPLASGLYVSVVVQPKTARVDSGQATRLLTLAAGVALAEAIEAATGLRADIKWPNDLVVGSRKVAGILAETARNDLATIILGYGINVRSARYPSELGDRPTSVESELGRPVDRWALCAETLAALSRRYEDLLSGNFDAILDSWRSRAPASRGARVTWSTATGPLSGVTEGIDEHGALLVRTGHGIDRIVGGEVAWG